MALPVSAGALVTASQPKRVIYFTGRTGTPKSALVTQLSNGYETVSKLFEGESATRTLLNLYNLWAVRGLIDEASGQLCFRGSMSGPHQYFGWVNPRKAFKLEADATGCLLYKQLGEADIARAEKRRLLPVPGDNVLVLIDYNWIHGSAVSDETRRDFAVGDELALHLVDTSTGQADSLFDSPGLLLMENSELTFNLLSSPQNYDLSPFRAQIVRNDEPFAFDQALVERYPHAQHRLRAVSYHYGPRYLDDYVMKGSGTFIERHEFIQAITPMNASCGGFVILGREVEAATDGHKKRLELIACPIPFGCTLLVDVGSIHGDSTLTGTYLMAMTGNHKAMASADTVFLKSTTSRRNVAVRTVPPVPAPSLPPEPGSHFLLTSDEKPLADLRRDDEALRARIKASLGSFTALWWKAVVTTGTAAIGWHKTLGESLPSE